MIDSLQFLYIVYFVSIVVLVISVIITSFFVIPLQYKESKVRNGLLPLRMNLLKYGSTILFLSVLTIITLSLRFIVSGDLARYMIVILILFYSIGFLYLSIIGARIWRTNYSAENKELHRRIDLLEKRETKRRNRES